MGRTGSPSRSTWIFLLTEAAFCRECIAPPLFTCQVAIQALPCCAAHAACPAGAEGELAADLAAELRPAVVAEYERALHAIFTAGAERRRRAREAAGAALDEAHQR